MAQRSHGNELINDVMIVSAAPVDAWQALRVTTAACDYDIKINEGEICKLTEYRLRCCSNFACKQKHRME